MVKLVVSRDVIVIYAQFPDGAREIARINVASGKDCVAEVFLVNDVGSATKLSQFINSREWKKLEVHYGLEGIADALSVIIGLFSPSDLDTFGDLVEREEISREAEATLAIAQLLRAAGVNCILTGYTRDRRQDLVAVFVRPWKACIWDANSIYTNGALHPIRKVVAEVDAERFEVRMMEVEVEA